MSRYLDLIEEQGYCIVENAIDEELLREVRNSVAQLEEEHNVQPGNRAESAASDGENAGPRTGLQASCSPQRASFAEYLLDEECLLSGTTCCT